ncbi:uncharacterized protein LOC143906544 [Temnothorax americanus]|uniref:uncharacterized protein LOC143906544 n=1 Tax=Temnothorax americanus TaxID=1964332 RepID=UPI004068BA1A
MGVKRLERKKPWYLHRRSRKKGALRRRQALKRRQENDAEIAASTDNESINFRESMVTLPDMMDSNCNTEVTQCPSQENKDERKKRERAEKKKRSLIWRRATGKAERKISDPNE